MYFLAGGSKYWKRCTVWCSWHAVYCWYTSWYTL